MPEGAWRVRRSRQGRLFFSLKICTIDTDQLKKPIVMRTRQRKRRAEKRKKKVQASADRRYARNPQRHLTRNNHSPIFRRIHYFQRAA